MRFIEDRVRQLPASKQHVAVVRVEPPVVKAVEDQTLNQLDQEIKDVEESLKKADEANILQKNRIRQLSSGKQRSRNDLTASNAEPVTQLHTYRDNHFTGSRSFLLEDSDLTTRSLIDIRTKTNLPKNIVSKDINKQSAKKRPQSSGVKRSQPAHVHKPSQKPAVEGEILMRISVKITEDVTSIVNVYKDDTAFSVADRCISQQLEKMKVII